MKTLGSYLTALIMAGAGVLLCMMNSRTAVADTIIMVIGVLFIICGAITIVSASRTKGVVMRVIQWVTGVAGIGLAVAMLISPEWFMGVLTYIFSGVLIICGLVQIIALTWGYKEVRFPGWTYIIPVILLIAGVTMIFSDSLRYNTSKLLLISGIGLIMFGVNFLIQLGIAAVRKPKLSPRKESPTTKKEEVAGHSDDSSEA
ncbi:MAG: DUF308 domain-containing protein [Muribaculaceae bacterium]|nr:DUF308 domain-containing protein [Muribaculaceae bacterium]